MKRIIKYILIVIMTVSCLEGLCTSDSLVIGQSNDQNTTEERYFSSYFSEPDSDLCLPRPISSNGVTQMQLSKKRSDNIPRLGHEVIKSGKLINIAVSFNILENTINKFSSLSHPGSRLINLCRLII